MATAAFLIAASMLLPVSACPTSPQVMFDVATVSGPVSVSTRLTLAQVGELADRSGKPGKHQPFVSYISDFGYTVVADVRAWNIGDCSEPVRVTVVLILANRRVEIGKELKAQRCLFSLVRDQYGRQAISDGAVLAEFAQELRAALQGLLLPPLEHDPAFTEEDRRKVEAAVRTIIDGRLETRQAARAKARDEVDTEEKVKQLNAEQRGRL